MKIPGLQVLLVVAAVILFVVAALCGFGEVRSSADGWGFLGLALLGVARLA